MNISANDNLIMPATCANCGKGEEESEALKNCVACKMVKYCSRDCQKAHRPQHKKECRKRAVELHDDALFKQPSNNEECPICFLKLPSLLSGRRFKTCCGKIICSGCIYAGAKMDGNVDQLCPFCRVPAPTSDEEIFQRQKKRVEVGDAQAIHNLGCSYSSGDGGVPKDPKKAVELWLQAANLGHAEAYYNIGNAYDNGRGAERDAKKAAHYWGLAAMGGDGSSRYNLGRAEFCVGNVNRALKHLTIAVRCGDNESLKQIKQLYSNGFATKNDYAKALRAYQAYLDEIKSDDRDKAAAFDDEYKYYE